MQTLWKTIDDILGNGYGAFDYLDLIGSFSVALIPLALPLTILLSSVMVFGDMAEKYEILSLKSAGVSFGRMLLSGLIVAILVASFSLFASKELKPMANKRYLSKMRAMKTNKLTFVFDEKIFNQEFNNYSIYIDRKESDGRTVKGILISDYTDPDKTIVNVTYAKTAELFVSADQKFLIMNLDSGYQLMELRATASNPSMRNYDLGAREVRRVEFTHMQKSFDLSKLLDLSRVSVDYQDYDFMTRSELSERIDTLRGRIREVITSNRRPYQVMEYAQKTDTSSIIEEGHILDTVVLDVDGKAQKKLRIGNVVIPESVLENTATLTKIKAEEKGVSIDFDRAGDPDVKSLFDIAITKDLKDMIDPIKSNIRAITDNVENRQSEIRSTQNEISKYQLRYHQQWSWAAVCIVFLFIGAPAGVIIRKGGFGAPMLIATGFYITFIMLYISGDRLLRSGSLNAIEAAWIPTVVLLPFALVLSYRAFKDTPILFLR